MIKRIGSLIGAVTVLFILAGEASAVIITNGGFEGLPDTVNRNSFNSTLPNGWTTVIQSPDTFNTSTTFANFAWSASNNGGDFAHIIALANPDLVEGFAASTDVFDLVVGSLYEIVFEQSVSNSDFALTAASAYIEVNFGGSILNSMTMFVPTLGEAADWINQSLIFEATAMTQSLTFTAFPTIDGQRVELALDGVQINAVAVPEPGTLALLGIGLFGMGAARRRKKA